jgi:acyl carrier protein
MVIEDRLRTFIVDEIRSDGQQGLSDDYPLIERGVLDSMGVLSLVSFIESEFGVEIRDEELVSQNFGTIADMARLVESKTGATP